MRLSHVSLLLVVCWLLSFNGYARGVDPPAVRYSLYADFDNKQAGQPIGNRGATFGEPINLSDLDTTVVEGSPGHNRLRVNNDLGSNAPRRLRWELLGNAEIISGEVKMTFDLRPSALDRYSILVRENSGTSKSFLTLTLSAGGMLTASDEIGVITQIPYAANVQMHLELSFDMDSRTSSMRVDGNTVFTQRSFGITDRGVGRLFLGYNNGSNGSSFEIDNLRISAPLPFPVALDADFDDKVAGLPIGLGGATVHEPVAKTANLEDFVVAESPGMNFLDMSSLSTATAQTLRWELFRNLEVRSGIAILDFDMSLTTLDRCRVALREVDTSSQNFMNLQFQPDGLITLNDANGTAFSTGVTYDAGRVYQYRLVFDLDNGIYDVFRDGVPLARERAHGITARGLGAIAYSVNSGAQLSAHMQMDSLRVVLSKGADIPSDLEFLQDATSAVVNQASTPATLVGAVNILNEAVPDGTVVNLEIAAGTGTPGAQLGGATASTVAGLATFSALTFDRAGTYRLVARSLDVTEFRNVDIVVVQGDMMFANGFD